MDKILRTSDSETSDNEAILNIRDKYRKRPTDKQERVNELYSQLYAKCISRGVSTDLVCKRMVQQELEKLNKCMKCNSKCNSRINDVSCCKKCMTSTLTDILKIKQDSGILLKYEKFTLLIPLKNLQVDVYSIDSEPQRAPSERFPSVKKINAKSILQLHTPRIRLRLPIPSRKIISYKLFNFELPTKWNIRVTNQVYYLEALLDVDTKGEK
jgi:hypothetical protein